MIKRVVLYNYKVFEGKFELELLPDLNVIVGDNETGKSSILEAVNLALTRRLNGRILNNHDISPYLFNKNVVGKYLNRIRNGERLPPPEVIIELYLSKDSGLDILRGTNNSERLNAPGIRLHIAFDDDFQEEYETLLAEPDKVSVLPTEYYCVHWRSFADAPINPRSLAIGAAHIDTTAIRLQSGADYFIKDIIEENLTPKQRVALATAYRHLKETFNREDSITAINKAIGERHPENRISDKPFSLSIDVSQKSSWETNLTPHLEELPFQHVGKGEQSMLKIMLALEMKARKSNVVMIEEPENHLSYSTMVALITRLQEKCQGKQMLIATHSAYVINKLGLENLSLLSKQRVMKLTSLKKETQEYFKKLSGYDTLRLVLAKKAILVEGPSDELIVQRAYKDKHGVLPIQNGVDVISVCGLSFKRFLDIAAVLGNEVAVVTDNDGDYQEKVESKYKDYRQENLKFHYSKDNSLPTLEPQLTACNSVEVLNSVLGTTHISKEDLTKYMQDSTNKTLCALKIFESTTNIKYPDYVEEAVQ